jgi:hypothetical protein
MFGTRTSDVLEAMKEEPAGLWTIEDVAILCSEVGLRCRPPANGSHYVVWHPEIEGLLTVPFGRRIKALYIKALVELAERSLEIG